MAKIKKFKELPYSVRKSPEKRHDYLADFLNEVLELEDDEEETQEEEVVPETRDLSITVNDGENAVSGVLVAIGDITGTTGPAGGCTLKSVADGEHTITATKEGYTEYSDTISSDSTHTEFTLSLTAVVADPVEETPGET